MVPTIDGKMHHFDNVGVYDALFVMQDRETKTLWNHITGEALYGPLVGRQLGPIGTLLQTTVEQALVMDPTMQVAISNRPYFVDGRPFGRSGPISHDEGSSGRRAAASGPAPNRVMSSAFARTLGTEDKRLSRMELGLGIVTDGTARFYPIAVIRERGALIDQIGGRKVLVFVDHATSTPAALYVEASRATLEGQEIHLDTGSVVRKGSLFDARGAQLNVERPQQFFSRWYGFSLTFPRPEIFGR